MFIVVNTILADDNHLGQALSTHFTIEAAEKSMAKIQRAVKRRNGASSYIPMTIIETNHNVVKNALVPSSCV